MGEGVDLITKMCLILRRKTELGSEIKEQHFKLGDNFKYFNLSVPRLKQEVLKDTSIE